MAGTIALTPSNAPLAPRSRQFTDETVALVKAYLEGTAEGQEGKPVENIGYGVFSSQGAARAAGVTLNEKLTALGAPHKYAVTVRDAPKAEDGSEQFKGILINKPAKERAEGSGNGGKRKLEPKGK